MSRFGIPQDPSSSSKSGEDIYSPIANLLSFSESQDSHRSMRVTTVPLKANRFLEDFEVLSKLGEGTFGEAFKVRNRLDSKFYAVKKAKERYLGFKDREQKLAEVYRAFKITREQENTGGEMSEGRCEEEEFYRGHCVRVVEAWEECGFLYI